MGYSSSSSLLLFSLSLSLLSFSFSCEGTTTLKDVNLGNPVHLTPCPLASYSSTRGAKDIVSCERVRVAGLSRLKIRSYANSFRITLVPSVEISERHYEKIEVCLHRNASLGLCQCAKDEWKAVQKGLWSTFISPYEDRYVDVKFIDGLSGSVTVSVEEEFQQWRLLCFAFGFILLLLAPIVSSWVPFYYSSSMAIGVFLVILILLFQGMKLLPTGRKSILYLAVSGSALGIGSFIVHHFSLLFNSILENFGLSEDMHYSVSVFLLVGVLLAGAALGYWIVRKFVLSEDGSVDVGIAQFVKWAMHITGAVSIFQSTLDTPLALLALASCWGTCFLISSLKWQDSTSMDFSYLGSRSPCSQRARQSFANHNRAEFLRRSAKTRSKMTAWGPKSPLAWSDSPSKGLVLSSPSKGITHQQDYFSTFHKTPTRKRFSKNDWEDFTRESTRQAMAEWASSPEFTNWIIKNSDRIQLLPVDSLDDSMGSGSDSSEETPIKSSSRPSLFNWL